MNAYHIAGTINNMKAICDACSPRQLCSLLSRLKQMRRHYVLWDVNGRGLYVSRKDSIAFVEGAITNRRAHATH